MSAVTLPKIIAPCEKNKKNNRNKKKKISKKETILEKTF
jgi:hypothetical protein